MRQILLRIIFFVALALDGCSTATPIVSQWRNPAQTSTSFQRLLIAGPIGDASLRRNFEDEFMAQLAAMGVEALPSYRYIPEIGETNENILKQGAREARADGLLLMRPVKVEEKTNYPEEELDGVRSCKDTQVFRGAWDQTFTSGLPGLAPLPQVSLSTRLSINNSGLSY